MNDFLKELFETYYKENRKQDKIELLEEHISFLKHILEFNSYLDIGKLKEMLHKKEEELKELKGEKEQ